MDRRELYDPVTPEKLPSWLPPEESQRVIGTRDPADRVPVFAPEWPENYERRQLAAGPVPAPPAPRAPVSAFPAGSEASPPRKAAVLPEPSGRPEAAEPKFPAPPDAPASRVPVLPESPGRGERMLPVMPAPPAGPSHTPLKGDSGPGEVRGRSASSEWPLPPERPRSRDTGMLPPPELPDLGDLAGGDLDLTHHLASQQAADFAWHGGVTTYNPFGGG